MIFPKPKSKVSHRNSRARRTHKKNVTTNSMEWRRRKRNWPREMNKRRKFNTNESSVCKVAPQSASQPGIGIGNVHGPFHCSSFDRHCRKSDRWAQITLNMYKAQDNVYLNQIRILLHSFTGFFSFFSHLSALPTTNVCLFACLLVLHIWIVQLCTNRREFSHFMGISGTKSQQRQVAHTQ